MDQRQQQQALVELDYGSEDESSFSGPASGRSSRASGADPTVPGTSRRVAYSEAETALLIGAICVARERKGIQHREVGFSKDFCILVKEILQEPLFKNATPFAPFSTLPSDRTIRSTWNGLVENGKITRETKTAGRKRDLGMQQRLNEALETPRTSTREIAREIGASRAFVHQHTRKSGRKFYRQLAAQELLDFHIARRDDFSIKTLYQIRHRILDPFNTIFTDESLIMARAQHLNKRNHGLWLSPDELRGWKERIVQRRLHHPYAHVWMGLHAKIGFIGPFDCADVVLPGEDPRAKKTWNAPRYQHMIETLVIPELKLKLSPTEFSACWWQQDGASAHTASTTMQMLKRHFGERILSGDRDGSNRPTHSDWPANSPDLTRKHTFVVLANQNATHRIIFFESN